MHLSDAQASRFYDLLDSLTVYANAAFGVTDRTRLLGPDGRFNPQERVAVHEKIWADPTIIDDYIEDNPLGLPPRELAQMHRWKQRVTGPLPLIGFDDENRALFLLGERRVAVQGITQDITEVIVEQPPIFIHMTLLPFDDVIVYDSLAQPLPVELGPGWRAMLEGEAKEATSRPIVERSDEFFELAKRVNAEREQEDWDRFQRQMERERWELEGSEPAVPGVHKGALAGLSEEERDAAIGRGLADAMAEKHGKPPAPDAVRALKERAARMEPTHSFEESLMADNKSVLERDAQEFGIRGFTKMRKAELAHVVAQAYLERTDGVRSLLINCGDGEFETMLALLKAENGQIAFDEKDAGQHLDLMFLPPATRLFWHKGTFTAVVPDEVREAFRDVDLDEVRTQREQALRIELLAEALTELCGIVGMDDLAAQYERIYSESVSREQLLVALFDAIGREGDFPPFEVWTKDPTGDACYVIHPSMGDSALLNDVMLDMRDELEGSLKGATHEKLRAEMNGRLPDLREQRDLMLTDLIRAHEQKASYGIYPIERPVVEAGVYGWKLHIPAVVNLRNWLDAHVPDDEDDLFYADDIIDRLLDAQMGSSRPTDMIDEASELGIFETSEDVEGAVGRVMALVNALPDWWNNGWPPDELHERATGRKVFRNPDGTPMKVGRNDPCPCGSGKKYKKCCGR